MNYEDGEQGRRCRVLDLGADFLLRVARIAKFPPVMGENFEWGRVQCLVWKTRNSA